VTPLDAGKSGALYGGPSFSLGNRAFRALWQLTWLSLASWTPPQAHFWRRLLLRMFGARIGNGARIYGSARVWYPPYLNVGSYSCVGPRANIYCMAMVTIGNFVTISQDAELCAGSHDLESKEFQLQARPISIGDRAWIAAGAFVGPGAQVGEGAVLGARSVAFKCIPDWEVHVGNPASFLKKRVLRC